MADRTPSSSESAVRGVPSNESLAAAGSVSPMILEASARPDDPGRHEEFVSDTDRRGPHLRPVWIVLLLLVPSLLLTLY